VWIRIYLIWTSYKCNIHN